MKMIKKLMVLLSVAMAATGVWGAFQCEVQVPAGDVGVSRTATVTYFNDGTSAIDAPYVRIEAGDNAYIRFSEADAWSKSVEFLATSELSPASSLRAGDEIKLPVFVYTATQQAQVTFSYTQSSAEAFPWSDIGASLKPSYVSDTAWTYALATLKSRFGTTWNSYLSRLRANADYLAENGCPVRRVDRLLQIEINHALGVDAVLPVLASVTDAARSARGMGLSFTRSYSSAMYGRFTSGILGYGWTDNLSTSAELSSDGKMLVFRVPGGGSYSFTKATGSWKPEDSRDKTVLAESSSAYTLTYQSGTVQTFAKSNMRTSSIADNSGNTLTFTWSGTTLQKIAHTDGQTLSFAYSGGLLSSVTDDCGRRTTYTYSNSLLTKVTASDGLETLYEYRAVDGTAAARALSRIVYPDGTTREFAYDTSSGLVSTISSNGGKEKTTISRNGLNVTMTGPDGAATTVSMGVSGEVLKTTDALGGISTKGYTADGLLKSVVSPSGLDGKIEHDALGRVSKSVSAAGTSTAFAYEDTFGNLKTVTDAKSHAVTYGYDAKGRGTSVTFVDGSASKLEYNSRGDVVKSTNRRGQTVTYAYDAKGRLSKKIWSNGRTFTYAYDAHGNVTTATDSETGTVTMQYDSADRLTKIVYPAGRGFTFSYDSCGRLAVRTSLDGAVERFAYDASGRLASVSDGNGATYLQNTYDATTGRLSKQVNGNGTSVSYLYDKLGRVVSIEHCDAEGKIAESFQYCYDADGRCIRASSLLGEERYGYDKDGQLISVRYPESPSEAFAYDAVGNRMIANGATYIVNSLNQYTSVSGGGQSSSTAITYDKDGNMTSLTDANGTTTYTYDTLNRLVAVKNSTKGIDWSCKYDVFGNRVSVTDNGVTTERTYLQGSLPSVAAEYVNGQLKERHIVVGAVRVADISRTGGSPVQNEETRYYHADLIGSTRLVTDGNGDIVNRCAYKAFGEMRIGEESVCGYVGTLGVETDSTGLLFMRNRYYSPSLGRFIQMDPIGLNGEDVNLYRYCGNDPVHFIDNIGYYRYYRATGIKATYSKASPKPGWSIGFSIGPVGFQFGKDERDEWGWGVWIGESVGPDVHLSVSGALPMEAMSCVGGSVTAIVGAEVQKCVNSSGQWSEDGALTVGVGYSAGAMVYYPSYKIKEWTKTQLTKMVDTIGMMFILDKHHSVEIGSGGGDPGSNPSNPDNPGSGGGSGGSGAIMNESDWLDIATNKNAKTATYSLGADITLSNPKSYIGGFKGKFIGNGHKVTMNAGKAIFQDADGATFTGAVSVNVPLVWSPRNCTFENCSVTANISTGENRQKTGGFADLAIGCTFKNCSAEGKIVSSDWKVGGLVGEAENCTFDNCSSSATVTGPSHVGGVVGEARDCTFNKSRSTGTVTAAGWSGGFVGDAINCTFTKCRSAGNVIGKPSLADNSSTYACRIGGFGGYVQSGCSFADCYSTATVSASDDENVGGFAGFVDGDSTTSMVSFTRCYTTGAATGKTRVGGFASHLEYCNMEDCYSKCTTTAIGEDISGFTSAQLGGFVGEITDTRTTINLTRCYAMGKVNAPASSGYVSLVYAGGFSWYQDYITAANWSKVTCTDCYWDASGTGQSKSIFGKSLSSSQINSRITSVSWYVDLQSQNASEASVRTAACMLTQYKGLEESGVYTAEESPVRLQGASAAGNLPLMSATSTRYVSSRATATSPRLYCYERYVLVKECPNEFELSSNCDAAISVSGLPSGLTFANGIISGLATSEGTSTITISAGPVTKRIPMVVIAPPADFEGETPTACTVTFNPNGGTVSPTTRSVAKGSAVGTLPTPTYGGNVFDGWYTSVSGGTRVTASMVVTSDVTYYARWRANTYTVRFYKGAGTTTAASQTHTVGCSQNLTWMGSGLGWSVFGCTFAGWATSANGPVVYANGQSVTNLSTVQGAVVNLYAVWNYTVTLRRNTGSGDTVVSRVTMRYGSGASLPWFDSGLKWTRTGYTFAGWSTNASSAASYANGLMVTNLINTAGTLYAQYRPNTYTVRFHRNRTAADATVQNQSFTYDREQELKWLTGGLKWDNPGNTFAGWATSASGPVVYANGQRVKNLTAANGAVVHLYAVWQPTLGAALEVNGCAITTGGNKSWYGQCSVKYSGTSAVQSGDISHGESSWMETTVEGPAEVSFWWKVSSESAYDKLHFYVDGVEQDYITGDVDWTKVTFSLVPGTHTLKWVYSKDGSVDSGSDCGWVDQLSITVPSYTIRFHRNDGSGMVVTRSFAIGKNHALPWISGGLGWTNPSGCTFAGWATSANGPVVYSNGQSVTNLATAQGAVVNLYAVWNYTLTLRRNTGSGDTVVSRVTMRYGSGASLPWFDSGLKWSRTGYTFAGWSTNASSAASYANGLTVTNLINTAGTLYAQYRPNTYTVRFHRNRTASDTTVQNQSFTYDREQDLKWLTGGLKWDNPGSTFAGWATSASGPVVYANGQRVKNLTAANGAVVHLYAVWQPTLGAALEVNGCAITTGGNKSWYGQCSVKYSGTSAVQSGDILHNESSWMETTVEGPANVSFWWKVSSESNWDKLRFYVDDVEQDCISGEVDWTKVTVILDSGTHTLKWVYSKDGSVDRGSDCGWVDQLSIGAPSYTIRFHRNDGTGTVVTRSFASGKNHELPWVNGGLGWTNPSGCSIVGWSSSSSATSKTWSNGQTVKDLASAGGAVDLYLVWTPRPYTIRFHKNDGTGTVVTRSFASGKNHALPWINGGLGWATPIGYNIGGWSRSSSATTSEWSNGQTVGALASAGGIIDLYAVWRPTLATAMDVCGRNVTSGGNTSWTVQCSVKYSGTSAVQSGDISHGESSWIETTVEGPAEVSFWWKVSSESAYDKLRFYVDGVEQDYISGDVDWTKVTFSLDSGTHTLKWVYSKDGSVDRGSDCGWVDQLSITVPSYTIRFHKNDGSGTVVTRSFASGKNHALPWINGGLGWTNPSGCSIVGWSRSSSATSKTWSNGQTVKDLASAGSSVDLYVVWSRPARSSAVFAAPSVQVESASSIGPSANPKPELLPGYYCGELADGTGMYDLLVDEGGETGYVNIVFDDGSVLTEEVGVDILGDIIIVMDDDGEMYQLKL